MSDTLHSFEAETGRILDLVINSLYKERDIFLRELVSNASDACDKLRYESLSDKALMGTGPELSITITLDPNENTITVTDNGIGMDKEDLTQNLGTIARSGTARFLDKISGDAKKDVQLIGQFGVGFYSAFMIADEVTVKSTKAGGSATYLWKSDGKSGYTLEQTEEAGVRGTSIVLKLKEDAQEYLSEYRVRDIVRRYSDHIAFPINLIQIPKAGDTKTDEKEPEQINKGSALWTRSKTEITEDEYKEFYHHHAHAFDDPFARLHFSIEGILSYTGLIFVPSQKPFDLYDPKRQHGVKLYVRRVFISSEVETLLPRYLRFVSGVVDSEDLQLNVSRETLQHGPVIAKMKRVLVKRILDEISKKAKASTSDNEAGEDKPDYDAFWADFGPVLKEGLYEDREQREVLLDLVRFRSTNGDGWTGFDGYLERMKEGQDAIYYISGESVDALRNSPQLEEAKSRGVEVLLFEDAVDEFWLPEINEYKGKNLVSLTKGDVDLSAVKSEVADKEEPEPQDEGDLNKLIAVIKLALGDSVKDVRLSKRLRESAVCLVADEAGMDMRLERFLKQHNQLEKLGGRILEINGGHALVKNMANWTSDDSKKGDLDELSHLLLDQARIIEGEPVPDPGAFSKRMSRYLSQALH